MCAFSKKGAPRTHLTYFLFILTTTFLNLGSTDEERANVREHCEDQGGKVSMLLINHYILPSLLSFALPK